MFVGNPVWEIAQVYVWTNEPKILRQIAWMQEALECLLFSTSAKFQVVMGPGSIFCYTGQVGLGQPSLVWVWKVSPKNLKFLIFFPLDQKNIIRLGQKVPGSKAGHPLIYCGSKVCWSRVGSGPISSFNWPSISLRLTMSTRPSSICKPPACKCWVAEFRNCPGVLWVANHILTWRLGRDKFGGAWKFLNCKCYSLLKIPILNYFWTINVCLFVRAQVCLLDSSSSNDFHSKLRLQFCPIYLQRHFFDVRIGW